MIADCGLRIVGWQSNQPCGKLRIRLYDRCLIATAVAGLDTRLATKPIGSKIRNPVWVPRDSNPGPTGYEPAALTAELGTHSQERVMGFEPTTFYLEGRRSTPELHPHAIMCRGEWI